MLREISLGEFSSSSREMRAGKEEGGGSIGRWGRTMPGGDGFIEEED